MNRAFASLRWLAAALVGQLLCGAAGAASFCVHNTSELVGALAVAEVNGTTDTIKLAQGTYTLSADVYYNGGGYNFDVASHAPDTGLFLNGGYDSACFLRTPNAANTVIDAGGTHEIDIYSTGILTIDGVSFNRAPLQNLGADTLALRRNVFTGLQPTDLVKIASRCSNIKLDSNVFQRRSLRGVELSNCAAQPPEWIVANNTFANALAGGGNASTGDGAYLDVDAAGHIVLANTVAWGNSASGVRVFGTSLVLATHNQWQSFDYAGPLESGSGANATADPLLDATLHLSPSSPAINTGTTQFPGGVGIRDAAGGPRVVGSQPDRGAYESAVDDSPVITVTTAADSGACPSATTCSLRGALTQAAAAGNPQRIEFAIPGACPQTITLGTLLPSVIDTLTIDAYTQPGSVRNSLDTGSDARLCVILHGNFPGSRGLLADNANSQLSVRGLAFENFANAAIDISAGQDHVIDGNQFGGVLAVGIAGSQTLTANARGIFLRGTSFGALVGGADAEQRNVIDASSVFGVELINTGGSHTVYNNYIGLAPDGATPAGNDTGVFVSSDFNVVRGNYIAASAKEGVRLDGAGSEFNAVYGNVIGLPAVGINAAGNAGAGISATNNPSYNQIGASLTGTISGNIVSGNGATLPGKGGIAIVSGFANRVTANRVYANSGLNIDLGQDGPSANDPTDADTGPNLLQNFPTLLGIRHLGDKRLVSGSVYTAVGQRIEVFGGTQCDASGRGDAAVVLRAGARSLIPPISPSTVTFSADIGRGPGTGVDSYCRLSATATSVDSNDLTNNDNTSELSACLVDDTIWAHGFESGLGWACAP